jgi:hypothetical protein
MYFLCGFFNSKYETYKRPISKRDGLLPASTAAILCKMINNSFMITNPEK